METYRVAELKEKALIKSLKVYGIIFSLFLVIGLMREDPHFDAFFTITMILGTFVLVVIVRVVALSFVSYSIENTVIEIEGDVITRSGEGLVTNSLKFSEVGKIKKNSVGLLLLKKGIWFVGGKCGTNYSTERDLIYIPCTIEKYDELESIINKNCQ